MGNACSGLGGQAALRWSQKRRCMIGVALVLAAALAPHSYATTPAQAVRNVLFPPENRHVVVVRANFSGRYATVLLRGARIEGSSVGAPILVERFAFGWQPLDLLNFQCGLDAHRLPTAMVAALMHGMPKPHNDLPCSGVTRDTGPARDVTAVRRLMRGPFVPYVVVACGYALGQWYGAGGGQSVYKKRGGRWVQIAGGGGEMDASILRKRGVPESVSCALGIHGARC